MLTEPGDLVVDIFGGSNTTGYAAETLNRKWLSFDLDAEYTAASAFRFLSKTTSEKQLHYIYHSIQAGETIDLLHLQIEPPTQLSGLTENYLRETIEELDGISRLNKNQERNQKIVSRAVELFAL